MGLTVISTRFGSRAGRLLREAASEAWLHVMRSSDAEAEAVGNDRLRGVSLQGKIGKIGMIHSSAARSDYAQIVAYGNKDGYFRQSVCLCTARQF